MKALGKSTTSALGFAVDGVGLAAAGGTLCSMTAGIAFLASGGILAASVIGARRDKFDKALKKARKEMERELRLDARFKDGDQKRITAVMDALPNAIGAAQLTPQEIVEHAYDAAAIANTVNERLANADGIFRHDNDARDMARVLIMAAFNAVLRETDFQTDITYYDRAAVQAKLNALLDGQADLKSDVGAVKDDTSEILALLRAQQDTTGVPEKPLRKIIEKLGAEEGLQGPEILQWLDGWVDDYRAMMGRGVNEDAAFQAAVRRAEARFNDGDFAGASQAMMDELKAEKAEEARRQDERTRRRIAALERAISYDKLAFDGDAAADKYVQIGEEMGLSGDGLTAFLTLKKDQYYKGGNEKGDNLDLLICIALNRELIDLSPREVNADEWAGHQNNLGNALAALGERESHPKKLNDAVTAFRMALTERTQKRVPLDWAASKNNLGAALQILGARAGDEAALNDAVTAFRLALTEYTQKRVPLQWAMTQNNLGNALRALGELTGDYVTLNDAVTAYRAALTEYTQKYAPLDWAMTQNNLGTALGSLGVRAGDEAALSHAVTAFHATLTEYKRERVPLQWAMTQINLGNAFNFLAELSRDRTQCETALTHYNDALGVYQTAKADHYIALVSRNITRAEALLAALCAPPQT
ncbi:hypothetical protein [Fretibacter rubidus]|uniref:hypothetical protein n=1 Tax=Fretibacter rubidus TaxID=570162 RepID=UPI00352BACC5